MSREATSFEAVVKSLSLDDDGVTHWAHIAWYETVETAPTESGSGSPQMAPIENCAAYICASRLPGVKLGDKVQVALYLK